MHNTSACVPTPKKEHTAPYAAVGQPSPSTAAASCRDLSAAMTVCREPAAAAKHTMPYPHTGALLTAGLTAAAG
jgi:hypothetical protein